MKIIGIDPSLTSTGIACIEDGKLIAYDCYGVPGSTYGGNNLLNEACAEISHKIALFVNEHKPDRVIVEYPAQTPSGFYLMTLHGWIMSKLYGKMIGIYTVPPTACNSYTHNKEKTKSYLVKFCKDNEWVPNIRINNDICTAVILAHLLEAHMKGEYKNTVYSL